MQDPPRNCDNLATLTDNMLPAPLVKSVDVKFGSWGGDTWPASSEQQCADYLLHCLAAWASVKTLDICAPALPNLPPLHNVTSLHVVLEKVEDTLLQSVCTMPLLEKIFIIQMSGNTRQMVPLDLTGLAHLRDVTLIAVVPRHLSLPQNVALRISGDASILEDSAWLRGQPCLKDLGASFHSPMTDRFKALLDRVACHPIILQKLSIVSRQCEQNITIGVAFGPRPCTPMFQSLRSLHILSAGSVTVLIPRMSAIEDITVEKDTLNITCVSPAKCASVLRRVQLYYSRASGEGIAIFTEALMKAGESGKELDKNRVFCGHPSHSTFDLGMHPSWSRNHAVLALLNGAQDWFE